MFVEFEVFDFFLLAAQKWNLSEDKIERSLKKYLKFLKFTNWKLLGKSEVSFPSGAGVLPKRLKFGRTKASTPNPSTEGVKDSKACRTSKEKKFEAASFSLVAEEVAPTNLQAEYKLASLQVFKFRPRQSLKVLKFLKLQVGQPRQSLKYLNLKFGLGPGPGSCGPEVC